MEQTQEKMLRLNIERLVRLRSKQPPQVYLMQHGFTRNEARSLLNPKLTTVKLETMTRLCALFHCYPNDLFAHAGKGNSHLNSLNEVPLPDTDNLLDGLSREDIIELARLAEEKRKRRAKG
jgi:DNA-binding Xre family transcriptional regulator